MLKSRKVQLLLSLALLIAVAVGGFLLLKQHPIGIQNDSNDPALKKAISDYFLSKVKGEADKCSEVAEGDYKAIGYDLDRDGASEFIVSIDKFCDVTRRSEPDGHGDYVIFKKGGEKYVSQGAVSGNSYGVASQVTVNGRALIYTTEKANTTYFYIHEWGWNPSDSKYEEIKDDSPVAMISIEKQGDLSYPVYSFYFGEYSMEREPVYTARSTHALGPGDLGVSGGRYFKKDITGDGDPEMFIQMIKNGHGNRWYEIFTTRYGSFENITEEGVESGWIDFDEIEYKSGFVYMTGHGNFERWMTQYVVSSDNKLVRVKGVGLYAQGYNDTSCHVRQINIRQDTSVSFTELDFKKHCNLWADDLYQYFDTLDTGIERAAQTMQNLVAKGDAAIPMLIGTYYDLTLPKGSGEISVFGKLDTDLYSFFLPYIGDITRQELGTEPLEYQVFRKAFITPDSPAASFKFPYRTGNGAHGRVEGKKLLDANTMLVYGVADWESYGGPPAQMCKKSGTSIDRFTFKKVNGEWKIWQIEENIDSWITVNDGATEAECQEINQDKIEKYRDL